MASKREKDRAGVLLHNAHGKVLDTRSQLSAAHYELLDAVAAARAAGLSIQAIADHLDVSKSRAQTLVKLAGRRAAAAGN